ncbi:MAG: ABC transporter permease subunit [Rectinema sp.]|nr:ABC transporter permease subunit [Rectinema sp.]
MHESPDAQNHRFLRWKLAGIALFLLAWQAAAISVESRLILPSPVAVMIVLIRLSATPAFWLAVAGSLIRVFEAFILSAVLGTATGTIGGLKPRIEALLSPLVTGMRATPVLALILLAMFWFPSAQVPVFSAVLMAFPVMHTSAEAGARAADTRLLEMSRLFHVPSRIQLFKLRIPSALPYLLSGARNSLGLCWKVVVAGEVLSQPVRALGTAMQEARLMLETTEVFAWAATTVLLCGLSEYAFGVVIRKQLRNQRGRMKSEAAPVSGVPQ